jgi:hypothetical protein
MLTLPAHHRYYQTSPFVDWANGITNAQRQESLMHIKLENASRYFRCKYIMIVEIFFNFISFDHIPFDGIVTLA